MEGRATDIYLDQTQIKSSNKVIVMTLRETVHVFCEDVDIFLLCEEDQVTTRDAVYTPKQIRDQLESSRARLLKALTELDFDIDKQII